MQVRYGGATLGLAAILLAAGARFRFPLRATAGWVIGVTELAGRAPGSDGLPASSFRLPFVLSRLRTNAFTLGSSPYLRVRPPMLRCSLPRHAPHSRQRPTDERLGNRPHAGPAGARNPGKERGSRPAGVHRHSPARRAAGAAPGRARSSRSNSAPSRSAFWISISIATTSPRWISSPWSAPPRFRFPCRAKTSS